MMEIVGETLAFRFPEVHPNARMRIAFKRTLRIPDDGRSYPLPPGLGSFPLRHVDDFAARVPEAWSRHGGIMLPMYQSEAMWLLPTSTGYPFAVKVATGKINAVTGEPWREGLNRAPQDYIVVPEQPWLDGYCVEKGHVRQFVAMPLGAGYTAEEQITGRAEHGGLQISVYPLRAEVWERHLERRQEMMQSDLVRSCAAAPALAGASMEMGLAPGGRMRQRIHTDRWAREDWDTRHSHRCFVHIANSMAWRHITGAEPPTAPRTAEEYTRRGLPWFDYYDERQAVVEGSDTLKGLKSIVQLGREKGDVPLPENTSTDPRRVVHLRRGLRENEVREGAF